MRLVFVSGDLDLRGIGGVECNREIVRGLREQHDVEILNPYALASRVRLRNATLRALWMNVVLLRRRVRADALIVDLGLSRESFLAVAAWRRRLRCPAIGILYHLRSSVTRRPMVRALVRCIDASLLRRLDRLFVCSEASRAAAAALGMDRDRSTLFSLVHRFSPRPDAAAQREAARPDVRFLFVGGVEERKGVDHAIRALQRYAGPRRLVFRCVGRLDPADPFTATVQRLAAAAPQVRVDWLGLVDDAALVAELEAADAFLFPSHWEGYGLAVEEAMCFGLPVICFRAGALPELVADGRSGWVVPDGDEDALAAAVRECAELDSERWRRGREGLAEMARRMGSPPVAAPLLEYLGGIESARAGRAP